jgi:hypothetical protein
MGCVFLTAASAVCKIGNFQGLLLEKAKETLVLRAVVDGCIM